jgi:hypothetical protein
VGPNRATKKLELRGKPRKCLHYCYYFMDPEVGLTYVRLQTWFPFTVHVGMNGREWLARQMDKSGLSYRRRDNCFAWIEDWAAAQRLLDEQLRTAWPGLLKRLLQQANPALASVEQRQQSAASTRKIRLLRAHGLIHKVPKTHRYQLRPHGRDVINALLAACHASTAKLAA